MSADPLEACDHADEHYGPGSAVMQVRPGRYECAVCGERFRLVPAAPLASETTDAGLRVPTIDELRHALQMALPDYKWSDIHLDRVLADLRRAGRAGLTETTDAGPFPNALHEYTDSRNRNLCDTCDRWQGAAHHPLASETTDAGLREQARDYLDVIRDIRLGVKAVELQGAEDTPWADGFRQGHLAATEAIERAIANARVEVEMLMAYVEAGEETTDAELCYWCGLPESEHPVDAGDHGAHRHAMDARLAYSRGFHQKAIGGSHIPESAPYSDDER